MKKPGKFESLPTQTHTSSLATLGKEAMEPHFTVADVARMWRLSKDAIRRMFRAEPGVLVFRRRECGPKRQYTTMRIPKSVVERVYRRSLSI